ncbi:Spacial regulator of FtsZ polymerization, MipZ [hydrothermal vent metagenome]|uniref:Spacial regulator of FtsZ polymerization, MipZ n=1 Tax=hydrothermal vent metagenome TaxID=652676 RepID=A0A3B0RAK0_9ZZZZ
MREQQGRQMVHIIVVGNEKGGAGKSTVSMHVATALARLGHRVGAFDLDLRQQSFRRYSDNRDRFLEQTGQKLPGPVFGDLPADVPTDADEYSPAERLHQAVGTIAANVDFIVMDCPGAHTGLSQAAHSMADTLITPLNDSFIDFDLLARIDVDGIKILGPSVYSEMVWGARQRRAAAGQRPIDWIVVRNRLGAQQMRNKQKMGTALEALAKRIGFRTAPGFSERVIFRELFPKGLTLLDLRDVGITRLSVSNIAARQELRALIRALKLPGVVADF